MMEWHGKICDGCGVPLEAEAFAGRVRRWWVAEGVASIMASRAGWRDGFCPACLPEHRPA